MTLQLYFITVVSVQIFMTHTVNSKQRVLQMLRKLGSVSFLMLVSIGLNGCFDPSQEEILTKVKGLNEPDAILAAIGEADSITGHGAMKVWRYSASEADICFSVVGNIALRVMCK